ncbi:unnamed protein product [Boreogadus saida]
MGEGILNTDHYSTHQISFTTIALESVVPDPPPPFLSTSPFRTNPQSFGARAFSVEAPPSGTLSRKRSATLHLWNF